MKNLKKLTLNARSLSHAEMKNITGSSLNAPYGSAICTAKCLNQTIALDCNYKCSSMDSQSDNSIAYGFVKCTNEGGMTTQELSCKSFA